MLVVSLATSHAASPRLQVDSLGAQDGLAQVSIKAITQDHIGFMWFATQDGLHRYDGKTFEIFRPDPENAERTILSNSADALLVDGHGTLWAGSALGLSRFDHEQQTFRNYVHNPSDPSSLSGNHVLSLFEDGDGHLWIGTDGRGLNLYNPVTDTFRSFRHNPSDARSLSDDRVNAIYQDRKGILWIGTGHGLNAFDSHAERFTGITFDARQDIDLSDMPISTIVEDRSGILWVGSLGQGLYAIDPARSSVTHYGFGQPDGRHLSGNTISSLLVDSSGRLWVGTMGDALNRFDTQNQQFIHYPHETSGLNDNRILSMYEDRNELLWIGTYRGGANRVGRYGFAMTTAHEVARNDVRAFLIDRTGALWVASEGQGILITHPLAEPIFLRHDPSNPRSLATDRVITLLEDRDGVVWVGSADGWLHRYRPEDRSFTRYATQPTDPQSPQHNRVRALLQDHLGILWVGVDGGGIHRFDPKAGTFTHFHHQEGRSDTLPSNRVFAMREDRNHDIWVATFGGGLSRLDHKTAKFSHFSHRMDDSNSLGTNQLLSIHVDEYANVLWLGTQGAGFDRFDIDTSQFTHYGVANGLPNATVYGLLQENEHIFWLSTNQGLSRFDTLTEKSRNYDISDGLQNNEFNGGAYYKSADGRFFFGGVSGHNEFHPSQIRDNPHTPPVVFTGMTLFNKPVNPTTEQGRALMSKAITYADGLTLSHKDYVFSIQFAALDFTQPGKNQYAYKMEGLEDQWNQVGNRAFATYTTLPPGQYTLRVKASNNHGLWNEKGASLKITIVPPVWQTWWFRLIILLIAGAIIFGAWSWRIQRIRVRNSNLENLIKTRTSELQRQKSNLESTLAELSDTKDALIEAAHKAGMAENATGVLHNIGNILNSVSVSASLIQERACKPVLGRLAQVNVLVRAHRGNLTDLLESPKGAKLFDYLAQLEAAFKSENDELQHSAKRLAEKIDTIKEVIADQQRHARGHAFIERLSLQDLVEEMLSLQAGSIDRNDIQLIKHYQPVPEISVQKTKVLQILLNLYKNAQESMDQAGISDKILTISLQRNDSYAELHISDTGVGIDPQDLERIFVYGSSSKAGGHGFGLHSSANYMAEMNGRMRAQSNGHGSGATFILEFPLTQANVASAKASTEAA